MKNNNSNRQAPTPKPHVDSTPAPKKEELRIEIPQKEGTILNESAGPSGAPQKSK